MEKQLEILTQDEIKKAVQKIFKRSQTDWEFRKLCLSDPAEAIREVTGKSLPKGFQLQFSNAKDDPR